MNAETKETIELIPTWKAAARIYMMALINGTGEGVKAGEEGIMEMAGKLDALNDGAKAAKPTKMQTLFFDVSGHGAFPIDQLRRYMLYPADVETAREIGLSHDPKAPFTKVTYRLAVNCETDYAIHSIIARFSSFGFHAEMVDEFAA